MVFSEKLWLLKKKPVAVLSSANGSSQVPFHCAAVEHTLIRTDKTLYVSEKWMAVREK